MSVTFERAARSAFGGVRVVGARRAQIQLHPNLPMFLKHSVRLPRISENQRSSDDAGGGSGGGCNNATEHCVRLAGFDVL